MDEEAHGRGKIGICAFCRVPTPTSEGAIKQMKKLIEADHAHAFYNLAGHYATGDGVPQDFAKTNELLLKAGELGCVEAYDNLGVSYYNGVGVEMDKKKAKHYWELAAMNGNVNARHCLGCMEVDAGNEHRAYKHFILAARAGHKESLHQVKVGFKYGIVTEDECANTLRAYQIRQDEMKSYGRDKAESRQRWGR